MKFQVRHFINVHKALVIPVVVGLMAYYREWGTTACAYLALHGTYAILWLLKDASFRDRRFEEEISFPIGFFFCFVPLIGYYIAPYIITSRHVVVEPWLLGLAISLVIFGVFFHYVGDAQKYYVLKIQPGLITDGLFARVRNPNYLGEMLIYSGFALLAKHWLPWVAMLGWWIFFLRNMLRKDASLSRYPEFAAYRKKSWLVLPKP